MAVDYAKIVRDAQSGVQNAFADLYEYTFRKVYYMAFKLTGSRDDAETLTLDTYKQAFDNLDKLENPQAFPKWLRLLTANLWKAHAKQYKPAIFRTTEEEQNNLVSIPVTEENFLPDEFALNDEYRKNMMLLVDNLAETLRVPIYLYYFCGFSYEEVGSVMDVREGTIRARLNCARKAIRDRVHYDNSESMEQIPLLRRILRKDALGFRIDEDMERGIYRAVFETSANIVEGQSASKNKATNEGTKPQNPITAFLIKIKKWFVNSKTWVKIAVIAGLVAIVALIVFGIASCSSGKDNTPVKKTEKVNEAQIPVEPIEVSALKEAGVEVLLGLTEKEIYVVMGDEKPYGDSNGTYRTVVYMLNSEEKEDGVKLTIYIASDGTCRMLSVNSDSVDWISGLPTEQLTNNLVNNEKILSAESQLKCLRGGILPMDNVAPDVTDKDVLSCYSDKFSYYMTGSSGSGLASEIYVCDLRYDPWWNVSDKSFMYPFSDITEILGLHEDVLYSQYRMEPDTVYYSSNDSYIRVYTTDGYVTKAYIQDSAINIMGVNVGMSASKAFGIMNSAGMVKMSETSSSTTYAINYYEFTLVVSGDTIEQVTAVDHSRESGYTPVTRPEAGALYEDYYSANFSTNDSFNVYADLTHDGMDEMIVVSQDYSYYNGASLSVYTIVNNSVVKLNSESYTVFGDSASGVGEYYLYQESGRFYMLYCVTYKDTSSANYGYRVFYLDDNGKETVAAQKSSASADSGIESAINTYKNTATLVMSCGNDFKLKLYNNIKFPNMDPKPIETQTKKLDSYLGIQLDSAEEESMFNDLGKPTSGYNWDGLQMQSIYGALDTFIITGKNYSVYGISVGMSKEDAEAILSSSTVVEGANDTYNLPGNNGVAVPGENWHVRITLEYSENAVSKISYYLAPDEE